MIARHEVLLSLYGAWRLFIRDPRGIEWLDDSIEGFWKSFFCAVIVLPVYMVGFFMRDYGGSDAGFIRIFTVAGIAYVISWVAWPLVMAYIAPAIGRDHNYIRYIVANNWSAGVQVAILLIVLLVDISGVAPKGIVALLGIAAAVIVLTYNWYVLRIGLEINRLPAAVLVAADFMLARIIHAVSENLLS